MSRVNSLSSDTSMWVSSLRTGLAPSKSDRGERFTSQSAYHVAQSGSSPSTIWYTRWCVSAASWRSLLIAWDASLMVTLLYTREYCPQVAISPTSSVRTDTTRPDSHVEEPTRGWLRSAEGVPACPAEPIAPQRDHRSP